MFPEQAVRYEEISIHALREEGDSSQSSSVSSALYFYPRPPRGGRRLVGTYDCQTHNISIHALREEGDPIEVKNKWDNDVISIHALREEGDRYKPSKVTGLFHFYPRPPRGGRRGQRNEYIRCSDFYPRPPRGGRPQGAGKRLHLSDFYPRPPRGGRRVTAAYRDREQRDFYPRPPRGGRPPPPTLHSIRENFYPRPPRGGRHPLAAPMRPDNLFLSTPSARRATVLPVLCLSG